MINPMDLSGKRILVTGASSGIGKAVAIKLSELGAEVIIIARSEDKLKQTISELSGDNHSFYSFDLKNVNEIEHLVKKIVSDTGKLDGLVHCAGIATMCPLKMTTYDFLHDMMLINFYAFVELVRVYSHKKHCNGGSIVVMSSVASKSGDKSKTAYCASKAAVDGAIRTMAKELAVKKIRINSIVAGFIKTDMYEQYLDCTSEETIDKVVFNRQFMGLGETGDVADAIAYLLSDAAKFITGTGMVVDGGYLT